MIPGASASDYWVVGLPFIVLMVIVGSAVAGIFVRNPRGRRLFRWIAASGTLLWLGGCAVIIVGMQGLAA